MGFKDQNSELIAAREEIRKETEQMALKWIMMEKELEHEKAIAACLNSISSHVLTFCLKTLVGPNGPKGLSILVLDLSIAEIYTHSPPWLPPKLLVPKFTELLDLCCKNPGHQSF